MTALEGLFGALKFDAAGLVPCVAQEAATGEVLMLAWMNRDAIAATLASGQVTYWSRERKALWRKGETSGHTQALVELRLDCDGDALVALVRQNGPACHTNRRTCFFRTVQAGRTPGIILPVETTTGHHS